MLMHPDSKTEPSNWSFKAEAGSRGDSNVSQPAVNLDPISWTASEFLHRHKSTAWYMGLFVMTVLVCVAVYLVGKDLVPVVFIFIMSVLFAIIASRKPRQISYVIDQDGLHVGSRSYHFTDFKSFSIKRDGAMEYISLMPLKRLQAELSVYFAQEDGQRIFKYLQERIPYDEHKDDILDKFAQLIRF